MASCTLGALPKPTPTLLFLSPTTTKTEKPILFPPAVFFETLLTWTTFSSNSNSLVYSFIIFKISILFPLPLRKVFSPFHGKGTRLYQTLFLLILSWWPFRLGAYQPKKPSQTWSSYSLFPCH